MERLPEISSILADVAEHFVPMARCIHPDMAEIYVWDEAFQLASKWLSHERDRAEKEFLRRMKSLVQVSS